MPPAATSPDPLPATEPATGAKPSLPTRLFELGLRPEDIRDEFEQTGRVIRTKTAATPFPAGHLDDDAVASLIAAKFQTDSDLSGLAIRVAADHGAVALSGAADSLAEIGKAMAIALDTEGVTKAISLLKLQSH